MALRPDLYYRLNPGIDGCTLNLYDRDLPTTILDMPLDPYETRKISGKAFSKVLLVSGSCGMVGGLEDIVNDVLLGNYSSSLFTSGNSMQGPRVGDSLIQQIESISPRAGFFSTFTAPVLDESVAAAGSLSKTNIIGGVNYGALMYFYMGISQDALGTSPHASYIDLYDNYSGYLIARVKGAINSPLSGKFVFPVPSGGGQNTTGVSYSYLNGDSVAHWFFLHIVVIEA